MTRKERIIITLVIICFVGIGYFLSHKSLSPIEELYMQKWAIVAQKPALESKKLEVAVKLGNLDMQIMDIDKKIYALLHPSTGTVATGAIADMDSFIQSQAWNSQKPQTWLVE